MCSTLPCVAALLFAAADKPAAYPRPDLLVEPADLPTLKDARILDARGKGNYLSAHIPGAVWVDAISWSRAFGNGQDADGWAKRIGGLGIDADTVVVVYDDSQSKDAARIWWVLRYWGVKDVRLLNGGWSGYSALKRPVKDGDEKPAAKD